MQSRRVRDAVALLLAMVFAVAGCTPRTPEQPAPPTPAGWPPELAQFTITWSAEPGIDVTTDGAVVAARAYAESFYLVGITGNQEYLYPGFAEAVDQNQTEIGAPEGTEDLRPQSYSADVWIGSARHHILSATRSGRDVAVTACQFLFGAAIKRENGRYTAIVGNRAVRGPGVYGMRIGLRAPEDSRSELPPQQGPSRAPFDNVFDGWRVVSHQGGFLTSSRWADYDIDLQRCTQMAETEPASQRVNPHTLYLASEFPTLPATPGWPDKAE